MSLYTAPTGDTTPYVKYNAKAGRWYCKSGTEEIEVQNPVFVADLANARKAWMHFQEGQAPNLVFFPSLESQLPKPSDNHKLGVSLYLFSKKHFNGVVKLESNSINTCKALGELYDKYKAAPESAQGKLPVVKVTGATPIKGNYGTNYEPVFVIEQWVDRPQEFGNGAAPQQSAQPAQAQTSSVSEF